MPEYLSITFELPGEIHLQERVEREKDDEFYPRPIDLIEKRIDAIEFGVRLNEDGDRKIGLSVHHVENESGKAYHASMDVYLTWETVKQLRNFFDLFVKFEDDVA
jgi:hypothetical protein